MSYRAFLLNNKKCSYLQWYHGCIARHIYNYREAILLYILNTNLDRCT